MLIEWTVVTAQSAVTITALTTGRSATITRFSLLTKLTYSKTINEIMLGILRKYK